MIIFNIKTIASICIIFLITGCNDLTASLEKRQVIHKVQRQWSCIKAQHVGAVKNGLII